MCLDCICTLIDLSIEAADFGQKLTYPKIEAAPPDNKNQFIKEINGYGAVRYVNPRTSKNIVRVANTYGSYTG